MVGLRSFTFVTSFSWCKSYDSVHLKFRTAPIPWSNTKGFSIWTRNERLYRCKLRASIIHLLLVIVIARGVVSSSLATLETAPDDSGQGSRCRVQSSGFMVTAPTPDPSRKPGNLKPSPTHQSRVKVKPQPETRNPNIRKLRTNNRKPKSV